ncbi:MAG: hypothetical protein QW397_05705 [Fervidicoccaceae archaeon]
MKISVLFVVAVVTIVSVAVIYSLVSTPKPGSPVTTNTYTPHTTPTSPYTTTTTIQLNTTTYIPTTTTPQPEEKYIESFEEFMNLVRYTKWRLKDYNRVSNESKIELFYYHNKGVKMIGDMEYTRVEFIIEEESGNTTVIILASKTDWNYA